MSKLISLQQNSFTQNVNHPKLYSCKQISTNISGYIYFNKYYALCYSKIMITLLNINIIYIQKNNKSKSNLF